VQKDGALAEDDYRAAINRQFAPPDSSLRIGAGSQTPSIISPSSNVVIEVDGRRLSSVMVSDQRREASNEIAANVIDENTFAKRAANSANTAQQIGTLLGGPLAVGGVIAALTASAPLVLAAGVVAACGGLITLGGLTAAHLLNSRRIDHEENALRFERAMEQLK